MSKYIIEIKPEYEDTTKGIMVLGARDSKLFVDTIAVENLEELNSDYINEHFGDLQDDAYNKGYAQCQDDYSDALKHAKDTAYQKGYDAGIIASSFVDTSDEAYQRGLNDAWECARKLFSSMADSDIEKAFPIEWNSGGFKALMNLQPQEAIERLKSYEDDKIKRGDIVNVKGSCNDDLLGVVTKVLEDNCYIMWGDGSGGAWSKDSVVKTGKHIDVNKFFEEIAT